MVEVLSAANAASVIAAASGKKRPRDPSDEFILVHSIPSCFACSQSVVCFFKNNVFAQSHDKIFQCSLLYCIHSTSCLIVDEFFDIFHLQKEVKILKENPNFFNLGTSLSLHFHHFLSSLATHLCL